ncbi:MAG: hypothetical protein K1000chlam3_01390 [Chlamydiae bacterium]|nr:hypothetical protein [Chlamydiota bacterium]
MDQHLDANKASLIRVKTVLDLTKSAREIYESSKVEEKRQILNFVFSNLEMKDKKPIITLRESFDKLLAVSDRPTYRKRRTLTLEGLPVEGFQWEMSESARQGTEASRSFRFSKKNGRGGLASAFISDTAN